MAGVIAGALVLSGCGSKDEATTSAPPAHAATRTATATAAAATATAASKAMPAALRGRWERTMRPKDWRAAGRGYPLGTWRIAIAKDGTLSVYRPRRKPVDFKTAVAVDGHGLTIDTIPICLTDTGDYGWQASAKQLTLTVTDDAKCAPRAALFGGTWKRQ